MVLQRIPEEFSERYTFTNPETVRECLFEPRAEAKLAWIMPRRDKHRRSQGI